MNPNNQNKQAVKIGTQTTADTTKRKLNAMLAVLVGGFLLVGMFMLFVEISSKGQPIGYGDIILFAVWPILGLGILSIIYLVVDVRYIISQRKQKQLVSKLHRRAMIVVACVGFGPIVYFGLFLSVPFQPLIGLVAENIASGPSEEQKASVKLDSFDKAQALVDGCNVGFVYDSKYNKQGRYSIENTYLYISARNNGTDAGGTPPDDVYLPATDKERLKEVIKSYKNGPYPACQVDIKWRNKDFILSK